MTKNWIISPSTHSERGLDIIRIVVSLVLSVHSIYRIVAGDVSGFGEFLGSSGFPFGVALAWLITLSTLASSIAIIVRWLVVSACICHMVVLFAGILMDHIHDGWFVVGGGRNGMEYSVVLIACLLGILWSYWPQKTTVASFTTNN